MAKRFLSLLLVVICATLHAMAQLITVKGNVVDKAVEPIIGASVTRECLPRRGRHRRSRHAQE